MYVCARARARRGFTQVGVQNGNVRRAVVGARGMSGEFNSFTLRSVRFRLPTNCVYKLVKRGNIKGAALLGVLTKLCRCSKAVSVRRGRCHAGRVRLRRSVKFIFRRR